MVCLVFDAHVWIKRVNFRKSIFSFHNLCLSPHVQSIHLAIDGPMNKSHTPSVLLRENGYFNRGGLSRINGCAFLGFSVVAAMKTVKININVNQMRIKYASTYSQMRPDHRIDSALIPSSADGSPVAFGL